MKFAVNAPNFGTFSNPRFMIALAETAEQSGWDGVFLWDHVLTEHAQPLADTWLMLTAMASVTGTIRLGPMVTPLPRRRPWKLAREAVTLDQISGGRLIVGLGLGDDSRREFSAFGDYTDDRTHGEMLDEALAILTGLWSGQAFSYGGKHYQIDDALFLPRPVQQPRIPIWIGGRWPSVRPFRRAANWDGVVPVRRAGPLSPADCADIREFIIRQRGSAEDYDIVVTHWAVEGATEQEKNSAEQFASAGATWFQLAFSADDSESHVLARVRAGPPGRRA